ncbi:MAG TPA: DUF2304 family protein [Solirubrobacterales bacterium]
MSRRALRRTALRTAALAAAGALWVAPAALADTITVEPGPSTLGEAILLAEPGDVIELPPGRFLLTEGDVLEEKDLTLRGAGEGETVIVPAGGGEALDDPGVTVEGATVAEPLQPADGEDRDGADGGDGSGTLEPRAQVIALIATLAIFLLVLELVRRRKLSERYALLWMAAAAALLLLAIWTGLLDRIAELMGIQEPANAIFILAFGVAFLLLLNFSVVSSRLSEETKILAQEVARLQLELEQEREARAALEAGEGNEDYARSTRRTAPQ